MKYNAGAQTDQEKSILSQYRFSDRPLEGMISASSLLDPERLEAFISELKTTFRTDYDKVAASIFIKRYAFLAVISLYSMSAWNKKLNLDPDNIFIEPPSGDAKWLPKFYFASTEMEEGQSGGTSGDRWPFPKEKAFQVEVLSGLFAGHLNPLVNRLARMTGVSKLILWENIAVYIMWLYETVLEYDRELDFIFNEAGGELFGSYHSNPLKKFYTGKTYVDDLDEMVRIRQTCCFSYLTGEKAARCKTCPCRKLEMEGKCSNGPENVCDAVRSIT